jgi:hypothetical protein
VLVGGTRTAHRNNGCVARWGGQADSQRSRRAGSDARPTHPGGDVSACAEEARFLRGAAVLLDEDQPTHEAEPRSASVGQSHTTPRASSRSRDQT